MEVYGYPVYAYACVSDYIYVFVYMPMCVHVCTCLVSLPPPPHPQTQQKKPIGYWGREGGGACTCIHVHICAYVNMSICIYEEHFFQNAICINPNIEFTMPMPSLEIMFWK